MRLVFGILLLFMTFSTVQPAFAQFSGIPDPLGGKFSDIGGIISALLPSLYILAAMIALLFLIWSGIKYMLARGDPKLLDEARRNISTVIIGLVIILFIGVIFSIIQAVFKIDILGSLVPPAYAQGINIGEKLGFTTRFDSLGAFFSVIVRFALAAAALLFFFLILWGGFKYLNSGGDPKASDSARQTITGAVIGLLIVVLSLVIIEVATQVAGIDSIFQ